MAEQIGVIENILRNGKRMWGGGWENCKDGGKTYNKGKGGADIFLDHSGSTYIIPKLSLYSTGLMPPKVILIRSSLYQ